MTDIDAHMLIGSEPRHWRELAIADVQAVAANLREHAAIELHLHHFQAIAGDVVSARRAGFGAGDARYVTFFDPDDRYPVQSASEFLRDAVQVIESESEVLMCYSLERRIDERGHIASFVNRPAATLEEAISCSTAVHGLQLWRRSAVERALASVEGGDQRLELSLRRAAVHDITNLRCIPTVARHWRMHRAQHSMSINPLEGR